MTAPSAQASSARTRSDEVVLRTQNLSKRYGSRLAVDQLNLEVRRGEIFGFLGPNGAGKTTTIRMALGLIAPTGGSVEMLGKDIGQYQAEVLPRVGELAETPALYTYMTGRDNLRTTAPAVSRGGRPPSPGRPSLESLDGRQMMANVVTELAKGPAGATHPARNNLAELGIS